MLSNYTTSTLFSFYLEPQGYAFGHKKFLGEFPTYSRRLYVIQLHYEYIFFKFYFDKRAEKLFFKAYLYFTLFCFLFASDYGIIFSKSSKKFSSGRFCFPKKDKLCRKR